MLEMTDVQTIITLATQGLNYTEIATKLHTTKATVYLWLRRLNMTGARGRLARNPDNTVTVFPPTTATTRNNNRSYTRLTAFERSYIHAARAHTPPHPSPSEKSPPTSAAPPQPSAGNCAVTGSAFGTNTMTTPTWAIIKHTATAPGPATSNSPTHP